MGLHSVFRNELAAVDTPYVDDVGSSAERSLVLNAPGHCRPRRVDRVLPADPRTSISQRAVRTLAYTHFGFVLLLSERVYHELRRKTFAVAPIGLLFCVA